MTTLPTGELKLAELAFFDAAGNKLDSVKVVEPVAWSIYPIVEGGPTIQSSEPNIPVVTLKSGSVAGTFGLTARGRFYPNFPRADLAMEELTIIEPVVVPASAKIQITDFPQPPVTNAVADRRKSAKRKRKAK